MFRFDSAQIRPTVCGGQEAWLCWIRKADGGATNEAALVVDFPLSIFAQMHFKVHARAHGQRIMLASRPSQLSQVTKSGLYVSLILATPHHTHQMNKLPGWRATELLIARLLGCGGKIFIVIRIVYIFSLFLWGFACIFPLDFSKYLSTRFSKYLDELVLAKL